MRRSRLRGRVERLEERGRGDSEPEASREESAFSRILVEWGEAWGGDPSLRDEGAVSDLVSRLRGDPVTAGVTDMWEEYVDVIVGELQRRKALLDASDQASL